MTDGRRTRSAYGRSLRTAYYRSARAVDRVLPYALRSRLPRGRLIRSWIAAAALVTVTSLLTVALLPNSGSADAGNRYVLRVMPLGDSITFGQGSPTESGYRKPLWNMIAERQTRYTVRFVGSQSNGDLPQPRNEGHPGYTIGQIQSGLDGWLAAARPDIILLHIGINDLNRNVEVGHAADRLAELIDRIYADRPGVSVVLMGLIPTTEGLQSLVATYNARAAALQRTEQERGRAFWYVTPPALTGAQMTDTLHPNDAGYQRMAAAFFPALSTAVAGRIPPARPTDSPGLQTTHVASTAARRAGRFG